MSGLAYLVALLASIGCMGLLDHRFKLAFWADARRTALVLGIGFAVFLVWDLIAIRHGFYVRGGSVGMTGVEVLPELPLEELFFIFFLCYLTLVARGLLAIVRREERS